MLLVMFTGATALVVEGSLLGDPLRFLLVLVGLYLTGGSANALNQYFEREIDATMTRTAHRRPLPSGQITPVRALVFSVGIGLAGVVLFAAVFNWLTAALALGTILFYSLFYTLWLKPNTDQNIVIGGIAGAMAPVGAWTAATGHMDVVPWLMFLLVFLWTPPHFWALALFCKDDYVRAGLPMMPVVRGERTTLRQMLGYTIVLFAVSMIFVLFGSSWLYIGSAVLLGALFLRKALRALRNPTVPILRGLFGYSILYLFGLFTAIMIDDLLL